MLTVLRYETEAWYPVLVWEVDFLQATFLIKFSNDVDRQRGLLPLLPRLTRAEYIPLPAACYLLSLGGFVFY